VRFQWRSTVDPTPADSTPLPADGSIADRNPDLMIRNLLDDARLRQLMTADTTCGVDAARPLRPEPILNRRRLLEHRAA